MLSFFLIFIIALCLLGIGYIIIRHFPQVTNLDTAHLPEEQTARKKKEIINKRVDEQARHLQAAFGKRLAPLAQPWKKLQLRFRIYVGKMERLWHHEETIKKASNPPEVLTDTDKEQKVVQLIQEGQNSLGHEHYDQAEESFIAAIKLDQNSGQAYRGLADTYLAKESFVEAKETYRFLLQLEPDNDSVLVKLAEIAEREGNSAEAIACYQQAVVINDNLSPRFYHLAELLLKEKQPETALEAIESALDLEPKNPKYLDLLIEVAILLNDKKMAMDAYNELRLVNPENQKLDSFKSRIGELE
jgi:tetratricopeptide (TPR) repeat protein